MIDEEHLNSFMAEVPIYRNQTTDFQRKLVDWFSYDRDLRHEKVSALLLAWLYRSIFLDYDKMIDIYASKYPRRIPLIILQRKN